MRILYVTLEDISLHKGSVVHIREVVNALKKEGHEVGLMARGQGPDGPLGCFVEADSFSFFPIKRFGNKTLGMVCAFFVMFFWLFVILRRYDVLYARDYHTVIASFLPRLRWKKRLVFEVNGLASEEKRLDEDSFLRTFSVWIIGCAERLACYWSDAIVSVTPQIASYLIHQYHCPSEKVNVVSNGVNAALFRPMEDKVLIEETRRRLNIPAEHRVVAFVGNLARWQGVESLIDIAPALLREVGKVTFLIVGDGPMRKELEAAVRRSEIEGSFVFTGMVNYEKTPLYINVADVCILPKRRLKSGYSPLKLYEYMACGKPIIASRLEGLTIVEEEGLGLLVDPDDPDSLKAAIRDLLRDRERRSAMGQRGPEVARRRFDWAVKAKEISNILHKLA